MKKDDFCVKQTQKLDSFSYLYKSYIKDELLEVIYAPGQYNVADMFTKPFGKKFI